jgi:hypothetical protein
MSFGPKSRSNFFTSAVRLKILIHGLLAGRVAKKNLTNPSKGVVPDEFLRARCITPGGSNQQRELLSGLILGKFHVLMIH